MRTLPLPTGQSRTLALAAALVLVVACGAAGIRLGGSLGTSGGRQTSSGSDRPEAAGPLRLVVPAGWARIEQPPPLPGFPTRQPVAARLEAPRIDLVAALLPAERASLLPAALVRRLEGPRPAATVVRVGGGVRAYLYSQLRVRGVRGVLDVLARPTTEGVATVACLATPAAAPLLASCDDAAQTVSVAGARPLPLGPAAGLLSRLPAVVESLDATRREDRAAAARGDAEAVTRLERAHRRAGEVLTGVAAPAQRSMGQALIDQAAAYERLARALRARDRRRALLARDDVEAAERRLRRQLDCAGPEQGVCAGLRP
jgi:hypothetical protein